MMGASLPFGLVGAYVMLERVPLDLLSLEDTRHRVVNTLLVFILPAAGPLPVFVAAVV